MSCALQARDVDLVNGDLHIAFDYVVAGGVRVRKDTKTHSGRYLAIDPLTCAMLSEHLDTVRAGLAALGLELPDDAYVFSNDPMGARPWNPDWATHKASDLAAAAGVKLNIEGLRHYTASQLLAARFDLRTGIGSPPPAPGSRLHPQPLLAPAGAERHLCECGVRRAAVSMSSSQCP